MGYMLVYLKLKLRKNPVGFQLGPKIHGFIDFLNIRML